MDTTTITLDLTPQEFNAIYFLISAGQSPAARSATEKLILAYGSAREAKLKA